ncbi:unnamed protein product [Clonostachys solani]|uniref:Uncharacterized protein n=1 Tax=Clonostachys solani TaxID=160281 RepID=A0A9N9ZJZ3_9HYPO|nr:unnamed protein product [Clonostachys solani]
MARLKERSKQTSKDLITWTRFHLPQGQEWPTWSAVHEDMHVGPLADVRGIQRISLGRTVEEPQKAAYVIAWGTVEDLEKFQDSSACVEFLRDLTLNDDSKDPGSEDDAPTVASRFLTLEHVNGIPTGELEGRITFTAYNILGKEDDDATVWKQYHEVNNALGSFFPPGSDYLVLHRQFRWRYLIIWFWVLGEDQWVEAKFGKRPQNDGQGRTIICDVRLWPSTGLSGDPAPESEGAVANPAAREAWNQAVSNVMPPVTAWVQERWDVRKVPGYPASEED